MRYDLAALDIDDTLLGPDGEISAANAAAVARLQRAGVRVVLASGRSHANMLPYHRQLGLSGPVVSAQGAVVRDAESGELWLAQPMAWDDVAEVTSEGRARGFVVHHYTIDGVYVDTRSAWTERDQYRNAQPQRHVADLLLARLPDVVKVIWLGDPAAIAGEVPAAETRWAGRVSVTPTDPAYLEFGRVDVSKASGVAEVARRFGVPASRVLAFGDGNNDAPVLAWAGLGVAMSHGRPAARRAARLVAPDGDPETSLARAIGLVFDEAVAA